MGVLLYIERYN